MIEEILKKYLDEHLDVPSFFEHDSKAPKRFVMIDRTGGTNKNALKHAVVAIQSYAESLYEAASLNEHVKYIATSMVELDNVSSIKLNSDYNFTDTETKQYRYQAVFEFYY